MELPTPYEVYTRDLCEYLGVAFMVALVVAPMVALA